ncbi:hypothetical protein LP414_27505 [Polaromonas sp. P1(28)-13]|nr:hypothetical protein LP414_27505 [Polaromonas sp. P1(28)-13]
MNELMLFGSTFGVVFFLGFQSLCVNSGHYWMAAINSTIIGAFNLLLFKTAPHVHGHVEIMAYIAGGPLGIISAMWVHRNVVTPMREERENAQFWTQINATMKKCGWKRVN